MGSIIAKSVIPVSKKFSMKKECLFGSGDRRMTQNMGRKYGYRYPFRQQRVNHMPVGHKGKTRCKTVARKGIKFSHANISILLEGGNNDRVGIVYCLNNYKIVQIIISDS
jgi:hypothetical protein